MNKNKLIAIAIIAISIILTIIGYIVLPETLIIQITASGQAGNTASKALGLLVPLGLSCVFAVLYYIRESYKDLFISVIGLLTYIFVFVFNL